MVGILVSFWDGLFSGAMLVSGSVKFSKQNHWWFWFDPLKSWFFCRCLQWYNPKQNSMSCQWYWHHLRKVINSRIIHAYLPETFGSLNTCLIQNLPIFGETPRKTNMSLLKDASSKEKSSSHHYFPGGMLVFGGVRPTKTWAHRSKPVWHSIVLIGCGFLYDSITNGLLHSQHHWVA